MSTTATNTKAQALNIGFILADVLGRADLRGFGAPPPPVTGFRLPPLSPVGSTGRLAPLVKSRMRAKPRRFSPKARLR